MNENIIKWISSQEGPIIAIPESHVKTWGGALTRTITKNTDFDDPFANSNGPYITHYEEVLESGNSIEYKQIDAIPVLIFGNNTNSITHIKRSNNESIFAKWIYADDDENILQIEQHLNTLEWTKEFELDNNEAHWILFDSATIHNEFDAIDTQKIQLQLGKYTISSAEYSTKDNELFDVYRFVKL